MCVPTQVVEDRVEPGDSPPSLHGGVAKRVSKQILQCLCHKCPTSKGLSGFLSARVLSNYGRGTIHICGNMNNLGVIYFKKRLERFKMGALSAQQTHEKNLSKTVVLTGLIYKNKSVVEKWTTRLKELSHKARVNFYNRCGDLFFFSITTDFYGCASASHLGPAFFFVLPSCWLFRCRHVGQTVQDRCSIERRSQSSLPNWERNGSFTLFRKQERRGSDTQFFRERSNERHSFDTGLQTAHWA